MLSPTLKPLVAAIVLLLACLAGYGVVSWHRKNKLVQAAQQSEARHSAAVAADGSARSQADSTYFFNQGRRYERARLLDDYQHHAQNDTGLPALADLPRGQ
jgi:hypothetical protein